MSHVVKTLNSLGVILRNAQGNLILKDVKTSIRCNEVQILIVIFLGVCIKLIHLLLAGRNENVTVRALFYLRLECA